MIVMRWWRRWKAWRRARTLRNRAIPDPLWLSVLTRFPFLAQRPTAELDRLRELSTLFLARKEFSGAGGLTVTDEMAVAIAAQACLPVLALGIERYDGFVGIVVHADAVAARRSLTDEVGVVHDYVEELAGEAMQGGPLMLAWRDVAEAGVTAEWGYNVVIHEFAHVLDLDARWRGDPALGRAWQRELHRHYKRFVARVSRGEDTLLDPYGAEAIEEFFAVAAEVFFVASSALQNEEPRLYELLARFFRQRPAEQTPGAEKEGRGPSQHAGADAEGVRPSLAPGETMPTRT